MAYTPSCMHACMHMALLQALNILLLASMLVLGSAEEAPSGYRIELIHVDANGGFTREELIRRAVDRTHLRAAMLSATDGTNSPASSGTYALNYSHYEYLMKLEIGTPRKPFLAVVDTGSDLVWTKQLMLCNRRTSSTFTHVNCSDNCPDGCKSCPAGVMCSTCCDGQCMFKKLYGSDKKAARGFMGNETLTLSRNTTDKINVDEINNVSFGCAINHTDNITTDKINVDEIKSVSFGCAIDHSDHLLPKSAHGIVGLNRGPMSLLQQLHLTKFSYCLSNQLKPELSSRLWLGDGDDLGLSTGRESSSSLQTTPLVQISIEHTSVSANRYYVELQGISIGRNLTYRWLQKTDFKLKSENGKGVMFVDSGCARTFLESTVFGKLEELLTNVLNSASEKKNESTCFRAAPSKPEPEMVLHFTDAEMHLPWANYMVEKPEEGIFCLAIHGHESKSVLGNFQQQNTHMFYDLTEGHGKLSFLQNVDCSKP